MAKRYVVRKREMSWVRGPHTHKVIDNDLAKLIVVGPEHGCDFVVNALNDYVREPPGFTSGDGVAIPALLRKQAD